MSDIEMAQIPAGRVTLHDARRQTRRAVDVESFEIGVYPITQEQLADVLGVTARHPRRPASDLSWLRAVHLFQCGIRVGGARPGVLVRWGKR